MVEFLLKASSLSSVLRCVHRIVSLSVGVLGRLSRHCLIEFRLKHWIRRLRCVLCIALSHGQIES